MNEEAIDECLETVGEVRSFFSRGEELILCDYCYGTGEIDEIYGWEKCYSCHGYGYKTAIEGRREMYGLGPDDAVPVKDIPPQRPCKTCHMARLCGEYNEAGSCSPSEYEFMLDAMMNTASRWRTKEMRCAECQHLCKGGCNDAPCKHYKKKEVATHGTERFTIRDAGQRSIRIVSAVGGNPPNHRR